jgi:hypothetical protein
MKNQDLEAQLIPTTVKNDGWYTSVIEKRRPDSRSWESYLHMVGWMRNQKQEL